jgi:hypothetical protein
MRALHPAFFLALLAGTLPGQISTTTLNTYTGTFPMSVVLVPNPGSLHAVVSLWSTSAQVPVDVTNPASPVPGTSGSAPQDQYCRAWYTPDFGGRLLTAHRFGGIRMWDASPAALPGPLSILTALTTHYSHEGLKTFTDPATTTTWLFYSEQHTSPTTLGGLRIYQLGSSSFTPLGTVLTTAAAGNALEVSNNGNFVWQWGDQNNNALDGVLRTYDTTNKSAPVEQPRLAFPYTSSYADKYLEKNANELALVGALGNDGLATIDITNPASPALGLQISVPGLHVRGVTFIPGTDYGLLWGFVQFGTTYVDFLWFFGAPTATAGFNLIGGPIVTLGFQNLDVKILNSRVYVVGRDRVSLASLLQIW